MRQGHAAMPAGDRRRRIAAIILLVNVCLVVVAALWRHAAADDAELPKAGAADTSTGTLSPQLPPADEATPAPPAPAPSPNLANDPVMDELRKVVRDPDSGLELPRLDETSPLALAGKPAHSGDWDMRLQQRIETVHALSSAALALVREAHDLSDAGQTAESAALMQHVAELRQMIAALSAQTAGQP